MNRILDIRPSGRLLVPAAAIAAGATALLYVAALFLFAMHLPVWLVGLDLALMGFAAFAGLRQRALAAID